MVTHGKFRNVAHEIVEPVVKTSEYIDGFLHVSAVAKRDDDGNNYIIINLFIYKLR